MVRITQCPAIFTGVVGIANTGVFADHASLPDENPSVSHQVNSRGKNHTVAKNDLAFSASLHILTGINQQPFTASDASAAVDISPAQNHSACGQRNGQASP